MWAGRKTSWDGWANSRKTINTYVRVCSLWREVTHGTPSKLFHPCASISAAESDSFLISVLTQKWSRTQNGKLFRKRFHFYFNLLLIDSGDLNIIDHSRLIYKTTTSTLWVYRGPSPQPTANTGPSNKCFRIVIYVSRDVTETIF